MEINGLWKPIALFLLGACISMIGFTTKDIIHQRDFVTRAEAKEMIKTAPYPWIQDRKYVLEKLEKIDKDVEYVKDYFWQLRNGGNK